MIHAHELPRHARGARVVRKAFACYIGRSYACKQAVSLFFLLLILARIVLYDLLCGSRHTPIE